MAANPSVCAVCLTRDRPEMLERARLSFQSQTYPVKWLFVLDTSGSTETIGELRNGANNAAAGDVILHWDDDDWSHPNRIAEQVAFLQASGADAVGYNEMLFWRTFPAAADDGSRLVVGGVPINPVTSITMPPQAWLYRNPSPTYAIGTSLCYWRETWKRKPFPPLPRVAEVDITRCGEAPKRRNVIANEAEDDTWIKGLNVFAGTSLLWNHPQGGPTNLPSYRAEDPPEPRMIASIHGGNTMPYNIDRWHEAKRVTEWDDYCRKVMAL